MPKDLIFSSNKSSQIVNMYFKYTLFSRSFCLFHWSHFWSYFCVNCYSNLVFSYIIFFFTSYCKLQIFLICIYMFIFMYLDTCIHLFTMYIFYQRILFCEIQRDWNMQMLFSIVTINYFFRIVQILFVPPYFSCNCFAMFPIFNIFRATRRNNIQLDKIIIYYTIIYFTFF